MAEIGYFRRKRFGRTHNYYLTARIPPGEPPLPGENCYVNICISRAQLLKLQKEGRTQIRVDIELVN